jgi:hypothetical protein
MNNRYLLVVLCLTLSLVFAAGTVSDRILASPNHAGTRKEDRPIAPPKWEFMLVRASNHDDLVKKANSFGDQGWELIGPPCDNSFVAYFKRPKP